MPDSLPRGRRPPRRALIAAAALAATALSPGLAADETPSELMPLAHRALLLSVARSGERLVSVGERGHVLLSEDGGATWTQVVVPTRATLTAVRFDGASRGWAVGHEATVISTTDGGDSWSLTHQLPGEDLPLLDVWVADDGRGFAVGAYGTILRTADAGATWSEDGVVLAETEGGESAGDDDDAFGDGFSPTDVHLNRLERAPDGTLFAAGEAGHLFRSDDGGETWAVLPSPYEGSFFALFAESADRLLAVGLRGNAFLSRDGGRAWSRVETATDALLTGIIALPDGRLVIHGLAGTLLVSADRGETFDSIGLPGREGIADGIVTPDGGLLLVGDFGTLALPPGDLSAAGTPTAD